VRAERPQDRWFVPAAGALAVVAGTLLGAALGGAWGALSGALAGLAAARWLAWRLGRRAAARRRVLASPFPAGWRSTLAARYDHYDRLPPDLRGRFEDDLRIFLAEKRITGVGVDVSEPLSILVAASAVTLSLAWPDEDWDQLAEVLLYPDDFDRDYGLEHRDLAGEAHPWGTVILSVPALEASFADPDDGFHVGIHEFAHLLDLERTEFGGIPAGLGEEASRRWVATTEKEMERLRRGRSVLDPYGAESPVEFLAVAVEAFFELPLALRARHRELYQLLAAYFGQDPAAWDDARGLALRGR
jgi:MtfA peptidase